MEFAPDEAVLEQKIVLALLQPQRRPTQETAFDLFGVAGILQAKTVDRRPGLVLPPLEKLVQQVGHAATVDAPDLDVDVIVQVAQDQPLVQHDLEPVGGQPR